VDRDALTTALTRFAAKVQQLLDSTDEPEDKKILRMYLAKAAILLDKVNRDEPVDADVDAMEKLFGQTWLRDDETYHEVYSEWDYFQRLRWQSIHGMTVNERLFCLGLIDEFDQAIARGDEQRLRGILFKCFLDERSIRRIVETKLRSNRRN
jgi:hypothetical protein